MTTAPAAGRRLRSGWAALAVTVLARVLLTVLVGLLLCALLPAASGSHPTVVMTGSMLPRLVPGDVVFSRPVPADQLQLGQVLLYHDPDQPGHLRLHRWVDVTADGALVTKGDANPERDSTPIAREAVSGVATLRVPFVARPVVWVADGRTTRLVLTGLALLATVLAAGWFRTEDDDVVDGPSDEPTDDGAGAPAPDDLDPPATGRRLARTGVAVLALVGLVGLGLGTATAAGAATVRFTATTTAPSASSFTSATYFSCGGAARASGARLSWPLGESGPSTAQDVTTNNADGTYAGGITYGVAGPCRNDRTTAVTLNGSSGVITSSLPADSIAELTSQVWIKAAPGTRGGTLVSFSENGLLGLFPSSSYAVGMSTSGALTFAFVQGNSRLVVGAGTDLRDNAWHQVTAVAGGSGMALYVDGVPVASNQQVPVTTASVVGTLRIGYGVASSLGTSSSNYFAGSVAFPTVWKSALPAATVAATYRAAS